MGKKYLLYIHSERFDSEPEKSKLVNELLDNHYTRTDPTFDKFLELSKTLKQPPVEQPNTDISFCKHNAVNGMCKKGCK